jgi:hypothetical protein
MQILKLIDVQGKKRGEGARDVIQGTHNIIMTYTHTHRLEENSQNFGIFMLSCTELLQYVRMGGFLRFWTVVSRTHYFGRQNRLMRTLVLRTKWLEKRLCAWFMGGNIGTF